VKRNVWDWLRACMTCGKPHEMRELRGGHVTWADPGDGHPYRRRLNANIDELQAEYEKSEQ
jgi:hypothetical protein